MFIDIPLGQRTPPSWATAMCSYLSSCASPYRRIGSVSVIYFLTFLVRTRTNRLRSVFPWICFLFSFFCSPPTFLFCFSFPLSLKLFFWHPHTKRPEGMDEPRHTFFGGFEVTSFIALSPLRLLLCVVAIRKKQRRRRAYGRELPLK